MPGPIAPFVGKTDGDPIFRPRPELLDETIIMFALPFASQERLNFGMPRKEFRSVSPLAIVSICLRYQQRVAAVPAIFGGAHLLGGGCFREWRKRRTGHEKALDRLDEIEIAVPLKSQAGLMDRAFVK